MRTNQLAIVPKKLADAPPPELLSSHTHPARQQCGMDARDSLKCWANSELGQTNISS
jgi:hypothetical protein